MYKSSYSEIVKELRKMLLRDGVNVGGTSGYPRVEIHSFLENGSVDKDGLVKEATVIVESVSSASEGEAAVMNEDNVSMIGGKEFNTDSFSVLGVIPKSLQTMDESSETQTIIYRQIQTFRLIIKNR